MSALPDFQARRQAIFTREQTFVWAGAGTGKTHTLTLRALHLLLDTPFRNPQDRSGQDLKDLYRFERPQRLAAARRVTRSLVLTTFTRKAAAEMQTRLFGYLDRLAQGQSCSDFPDPLSEELTERILVRLQGLGEASRRLRVGAQALSEVAAEMRISTLHSFAASLLRRYPLEAGAAAGVMPDEDDPEQETARQKRLLECWWKKAALQEGDLQADLEVLLKAISVRELDGWLGHTVRHRWMSRPQLGPSADIDTASQACRNLLAQLGGERPLTDVWIRFARLADQAGDPDSALALSRLIDSQPFLFRSPHAVRAAIEKMTPSQRQFFEDPSRLKRALVAYGLAEGALSAPWKAFLRVLEAFGRWLEDESLSQTGEMGFEDVIRLAVRLLESHPSIRRREKRRMQALLVDEFQDTDPEQLRLLAALLRSEPAPGCRVEGFFVGDTKQSIYRFRGAELSEIDRFRNTYATLSDDEIQDLHLTTSFRSRPPIVEWVNHFFRDVVPLTRPEEELQTLPASLATARNGATPGALPQLSLPFLESGIGAPVDEKERPRWIQIQAEPGRQPDARTSRIWAARRTVQAIVELVAEGFELRRILVLVRKQSEIEPLLQALDRAGIPCLSSGARTFYRHPEVLDLLNLLIALHHPADSLAAAALLKSPLVGLDDRDLHRLRESIQDGSLLHGLDVIPPEVSSNALKQIEALRGLIGDRRSKPFPLWLEEVEKFVPLAPYLIRGHQGRPVARIRRLLKEFRVHCQDGARAPLPWLLERRRQAADGDRYDADLGEDVSLADESIDAVRVLTIHKVKGLEGKAVIVASWHSVLEGLNGEFPWGDPPIIRKNSRTGDFKLRWGGLPLETASYQDALKAEGVCNAEEAQRLAYVAATRACERLTLICSPHAKQRFADSIEEFRLDACRRASSDPEKQALLCDGFLRFVLEPPPSQPPRRRRLRRLSLKRDAHREVWSDRLNRFREAPLWLSPTVGAFLEADPPEFDLVPGAKFGAAASAAVARQAGLLVHTYLERHLDESGFREDRLRRLSEEGHYDESAIVRAEGILKRFFSGELMHPSGTSYLKSLRSWRVMSREMPVYLQIDDQPWYGVVDLLLDCGTRLLGVDFKTSPRMGTLPAEQQRQERIYGEALRRAFPDRQVGFEFWWLGE